MLAWISLIWALCAAVTIVGIFVQYRGAHGDHALRVRDNQVMTTIAVYVLLFIVAAYVAS